MPLVRVPTAGSQIIASATVERRRTLTLAAGASLLVSDMQIQVNNLPNAFLYFYQPAGVNGLAFQPIFAVDNTSAGGVVIPRWLPLAPRAELHTAADKTSVAYRRHLSQLGITFGVC